MSKSLYFRDCCKHEKNNKELWLINYYLVRQGSSYGRLSEKTECEINENQNTWRHIVSCHKCYTGKWEWNWRLRGVGFCRFLQIGSIIVRLCNRQQKKNMERNTSVQVPTTCTIFDDPADCVSILSAAYCAIVSGLLRRYNSFIGRSIYWYNVRTRTVEDLVTLM